MKVFSNSLPSSRVYLMALRNFNQAAYLPFFIIGSQKLKSSFIAPSSIRYDAFQLTHEPALKSQLLSRALKSNHIQHIG